MSKRHPKYHKLRYKNQYTEEEKRLSKKRKEVPCLPMYYEYYNEKAIKVFATADFVGNELVKDIHFYAPISIIQNFRLPVWFFEKKTKELQEHFKEKYGFDTIITLKQEKPNKK